MPRPAGPRDGDAHRHAHGHVALPSTAHPHHAPGASPGADPARDGTGGHDRHAGHSVDMFRRKFWGTLLLTIPTVVWAPMIQHWLGYQARGGPTASRWIPALFGTLVFAYGGWVFIEGARGELADRRPGMMTLIALAITVAFVFSLAVTLGFPGVDLWWELATLVTIMVLGHWIEMRSIAQARGALKELARLLPDTALRVVGDRTEAVPVAELREGDLVLVRPGGGIPADGVVRDGASDVNESMITGESRPVRKEPGRTVIAGTVNGSGSLRIEVTGTGEKTALAGIMRLVADAQTSRSRAQALADRAALLLTIVAVVAAALTLAGWLLAGREAAFVIERVVTVLVIACPHALGLAIPLVVAISTTLGARSGLLVRDRRGLEEARNVTAVFFDKTGTLTRGEFRVVEITTRDGVTHEQALALAAAVERDSEHTIARGIVQSAEERGLSIPRATGFRALPGHGVEATVGERPLRLGGPALLRRLGVEMAPDFRAAIDRAAARGQAAITMLDGTTPLAVLAVADAVREESPEAVRRLHAQGIQVIMMTGDARPVANAVAADLGIETVFAEVLPEDKAATVKAVQAQGKRVAMVGDGVNDAPALLTADVGIAIGAGTDVAVEAGDVVLIRSDPRDVPRIIALSKATYRKMVQNLWWAAGYNVVAIPLAAGVLAPWGILLHPAVGAVLMSLSTVIVAINAQLLRRTRLDHDEPSRYKYPRPVTRGGDRVGSERAWSVRTREARGPMIPDRVVEVLRGPAVMLVGTRDAGLRPAHTVAVGAIVHDDRRTVTFFVPESRSARLLTDLQDNGRVAFSFGWVSHEAYQLKGTYLTARPTAADDIARQEAYRAALLEAARQAYPEEIARPFALGVAYHPGVAITFRVDEVYRQTPGPGAGARMA